MNIAQLKILSTHRLSNYHVGDVVAFQREPGVWLDPWGGEFDENESNQFNAVAAGKDDVVFLRNLDGDHDREVPCRLAVEF